MSPHVPADTAPCLRPDSETVPQDWQLLQRHLRAAAGLHLDLARPPRQFAGGLGNLNYLVSIDGAEYVLRRPPPGPLPRGANDMAREHRVLSVLWKHFPLAPRSIFHEGEATVLGAPFLIMEYRPGQVLGGAALPPGLDSRTAGPSLASMMVEVLAGLHAVDPRSAGLHELGRPEGFLARNVEGWARRAMESAEGAPHPAAAATIDWLRARPVPEQPPVLLHSDFKLDNLVLDPLTLRPRALLDWDMSTRGDPLFDLATLLSYWVEPGDPPALQLLRQMPTALPGFPTRAEVVRAYAAATGRDVSDFLFHRVLALLKLGIVFQQLHARYRLGATQDARYAEFGALSEGILIHAHDVARCASL